MVIQNPFQYLIKGRHRRREYHVFLAIAGIYLILWLILPKPSFWGVDNGFKYQGMKSFAERGSLQIHYDGSEIDPEGRLRPIVKPFGVMKGKNQIPVFSTIFMLIGGVLFFLVGHIGPWLMPLFGGWLTLFFAWLTWIRHKKKNDGRLFLIMLGFGSPLLFYSLTLWEHSLAIAFVTLAMSLVCRTKDERDSSHDMRNSIVAGILMTIAVMLRTESIFWIPIIAMFWKFTKRNRVSNLVFVLVSSIGILVALVVNKILTGTYIPLHILTNMSGYRPVSWRLWNKPTAFIFSSFRDFLHYFYSLIVEGFANNKLSLLGLIPLIVVGTWRGWRRNVVQSIIFSILLLIAGSVYIYSAGMSGNRVAYTLQSGGLLWVSPFVILGVRHLRSRNMGFWKMAWLSPYMFIVFVLVLGPIANGVHWGPRLGLEIIPFMLISGSVRAYKWWRNFKPTRYVIVTLVLFSVLNQLYSYDTLLYARNDNGRLNEWAAVMKSETVLTNVWWLSGDCATVSDQQEWYNTPRGENVSEVVSSLRERGKKQFIFYEIEPLIPKDKWGDIGVEIIGTQEFRMTGIRTKYVYNRSLCKILPERQKL